MDVDNLLKEKNDYLKRIKELFKDGKMTEGIEAAEIFLKLAEKTGNWKEYVEVRNDIGSWMIMSRAIENFETVQVFIEETLEIAQLRLEEASKSLGVATNILGYWYGQIMQNPKKAQPLFEKNLQISLAIEGELSKSTILAYNNLAFVYGIHAADIKIALNYAEKAVYLLEKLLSQENKEIVSHYALILPYMNVGAISIEANQYTKTLYYLNLALEKCNELEFPSKKETLGQIYHVFHRYYLYVEEDYQQALLYAKKTLETRLDYFQQPHVEVVLAYNQVAFAYSYLEDYDNALNHFCKGLQLAKQIFQKNSDFTATSLKNIASVYFQQKKYLKAIETIQEAFAYMLPNFEYNSIYDNPVPAITANTQLYFRIFHLKIKNLWECYLQGFPTDVDETILQNTTEKMIALLDIIKTSYQTQEAVLVFLSSNDVSEAFNLALKISLEFRQYSKAFTYSEKNKANILLSSIKESVSRTLANIPKQQLEREYELQNNLTYLKKQIAKEEAKGENQREKILLQWKSQFFDLHQEYLQLIQQFEQEYPDYYQLKYETQTISIEAIQQSLTENQMMVNYFVGEKFLYIFFVSKDDFEVHQVEIGEDFEKLVHDFLQSIQNHQFEKYAETAYELYQYLLQPLEMHLIDFFAEPSMTEQNKAAKKLLIIPHSILSYVPFEALICSPAEDLLKSEEEKEDSFNRYHDLDYLLWHCEVSYHYSATLWHYLLKQHQQKGGERASMKFESSFVGFAPVYEAEERSEKREVGSEKLEGGNDTLMENLNEAAKAVGQWATRSEALRSDGSWNPLPHSKTEAQNIAALFGENGFNSQAFLHEQATKEQFQQVVEEARFLLVAAHGVVNDEQPKLSGLVFFPQMREVGSEKRDTKEPSLHHASRLSHPTSETDCILSMEETYHLNLSKTALVVLSSCESGIGTLAKGEGMMAVNRGFLYAGAKNVVSTLFKVYDRPSSLLTQYLFEEVLKNLPQEIGGLEYSAALRAAKLKLLKEEEVDVKSWSGFVLIGTN